MSLVDVIMFVALVIFIMIVLQIQLNKMEK